MADGVGDHPLGVLGAAEGVFAEEFAGGGDVEAVEACVPSRGRGGVGVGVEEGADFSFLEGADAGDGEADEVDYELFFGEGDVSGDGTGGIAGGAPVAAFLGCNGKGAEQE